MMVRNIMVHDHKSGAKAGNMDFQLPEQLWQIFATVVGGVISAFTGYLAQKLSERRSRNTLLMTRLEEIYGLCQALYDAHLERIYWFLGHEQITSEELKSSPKHPGTTMSELKMKVRSYAPNLLHALDRMDEGHQSLKGLFNELEARSLRGDVLSKGIDYDADTLEKHIETLGLGANEVKAGAVIKLRQYFS